jgi:hypothetical protein
MPSSAGVVPTTGAAANSEAGIRPVMARLDGRQDCDGGDGHGSLKMPKARMCRWRHSRNQDHPERDARAEQIARGEIAGGIGEHGARADEACGCDRQAEPVDQQRRGTGSKGRNTETCRARRQRPIRTGPGCGILRADRRAGCDRILRRVRAGNIELRDQDRIGKRKDAVEEPEPLPAEGADEGRAASIMIADPAGMYEPQ